MKATLPLFLLFLFGSLTVKPVKSQSILIEESYNKDTTISLKMIPQSFGLTVSGSFSLNSDTSEVRIVLVATDGNQYLICDYNSAMIPLSTKYSFSNYSLESSYLSSTNLNHIELRIVDASLKIDTLNNNLTLHNKHLQMNNQKKKQLDIERLQLVKNQISSKKLSWIADTNAFSNLSYMEKMKYFGNPLPNLYGFEYYCGGFFSFPYDGNAVSSKYSVVPDFDWRSRHGANNPNSPYYDGDNIDFSGWNTTRVETQNPSNCWAFSGVYSLEAIANLYYNSHLNLNLSEQNVVSCSGGQVPESPTNPCPGGIVPAAISYILSNGVVNESCFPYTGECGSAIPSCSVMCSDPVYRIKPSSTFYINSYSNPDIIKQNLITYGPLVGVLYKWGHAMSLVGYGVVKQGDPILYGNLNHTGIEYTVGSNSPDIGKNYWIFKQSWGSWGNSPQTPYIYVIADPAYINVHGMRTPLINTGSNPLNDNNIACNDFDGDGYYWWGIGDKPATCLTCPDEEDCDDSNPFLGPYDGVYNCTLLCDNFFNTGGEIEIDQSTTYYSDQFINKNIRIKPGATLTINNCTVQLASETKIIVESGAKLILDKSVLTNQCGKLWQGIELQGNSSLSQLTPGAQGQVILKNGAVIENAMDGITTIANVEDMSSWDWSKTGGIIKAENSTFRNCRRGIQFLTYNNVHPTLGSNLPNLSTIRNCIFETTTDLPDGIMPYAFISMNEVNGVKLYGNTFQNTNPNANWFTLGMGIYSINASYLVDQICLSPTIPCSNAQKSRFINLHYGIRSSSTPGLKAVTVKNTVFDLCHFGVYFSGMEYPTVINNDFIVDDYTFHMMTNEYGYGLYLNQCNGFQVEGNDFMSPTSGNRGWTGIYVNNSNTGNGANSSNQIYRNTFTDLYSGIVALNNNKAPAYSDGLKFNCETFNGNTYDISVLPKSNPNIGISAVQGYYVNDSYDAKTLSRNWYSATCAGDENQFKIDWYSGSEYPIMHANYSGAHWQPECYDPMLQTYSPPLIENITYSSSDCPDRTIINPIAIRTELQAVSTKKEELNNLIDGGQSNLLVSIAQSNIPEGQMLQTMLEFSPYLSDEVLLMLIERPNALSPGTMQQILAANSPLSDEVYQAVQAMQTPLPKGIRNQIAALQTGEMSDRDQLPYGIAYYEYTEKVLESDLVRYYLNDTLTVNPMDSVMNILEQATTKNSKLNLVSAYISSRHFAKANQTLDSLVNIDADLVSYSEKQRMNILTADLPGKELSLLTDSSKMQVLQSIANDTLQYGAVYAKNTLELLNDTLFAELTLIPMPETDNRSMIAYSSGDQPEIENGLITCYPNPAGEKFTAHYEVESVCSEMFLVIHNVMGKEVSRIRVNECIGDVELSSPAESGTYYVYIESCGQYIAIDKIVVTR